MQGCCLCLQLHLSDGERILTDSRGEEGCLCLGLRRSLQLWAAGFQRRVRVISRASGPTQGVWEGKQGRRMGRGVCALYQLLRISEPRLFARQRSAAAGRQTHPLASGAAYTLSGARRLIPRLKFTFAPSRLNSHFSSSHNTSLSRDTENDGLPTRPACKVCTLAPIFFFFKHTH